MSASPVPPKINFQIISKFRAASVAADRGMPETTSLADEFFEAISAIPIADPINRTLAFETFNLVISQVERLPTDRAFEPTMIAADALAACVLRSAEYISIARNWAVREHAVPRTAAMRTYSKLALYDSSRIDWDVLYELARRIAKMTELTKADELPVGYFGQVVGKLRGNENGIRLIEQLAVQGPVSRVIAAHSIAYDLALDPPSSWLSVFRNLDPISLRSDPPNNKLLWLFLALSSDPNRSVADAAKAAAQVINYSWPELGKKLLEFTFSGTVVAMTNPVAASQVEYPTVINAESAIDLAIADLCARTGRQWTRAELASLTHRQLARPLDAAAQPKGIDFALRFPGASNRRDGVLTWDPELLEQDMQSETSGEDMPKIIGAPRLFISYRWSDRTDDLVGLEFLAGDLFNRGYDIIFDRDPRHLDKVLSAGDVLLLLYGCTHFVPVITEELLTLLADPKREAKSHLEIEWELARELSHSQPPMQWLGIWYSGSHLPRHLATCPVVDLRVRALYWDAIEHAFPICQFEVRFFSRNGTVQRLAPVDRQHLREAIKKAHEEPSFVRLEVHDVTRRDKHLFLSS